MPREGPSRHAGELQPGTPPQPEPGHSIPHPVPKGISPRASPGLQLTLEHHEHSETAKSPLTRADAATKCLKSRQEGVEQAAVWRGTVRADGRRQLWDPAGSSSALEQEELLPAKVVEGKCPWAEDSGRCRALSREPAPLHGLCFI